MPIEGRILSATVSQTPSGKYYVALCCTDLPQPESIKTNKYVGLDLGIKDFVITSDAVIAILNTCKNHWLD